MRELVLTFRTGDNARKPWTPSLLSGFRFDWGVTVIRTFVGRACALAAVGMVLGAPFAVAEERAATVTGVLFDDANRNGVRDAGEHGLAGLRVQGPQTVTTDATGRYTFTGVGLNDTVDVFLPTAAELGNLTLSKPADATSTAWISGWVYIKVGADPAVTHDFGYGRWGASQSVGLRTEDNKTTIKVGEKLRVTAYTTTHATPGYGGVEIVVPPGMHVVHQELNPAMDYEWIGTKRGGMWGLRTQEPGYSRESLVDIVADKPMDHAEISAVLTHDEGTDVKESDDWMSLDLKVVPRAAKPVDQVVSPVHHSPGGTGTTQAKSSESLAYTGVEPQPYLAAGVALLGVGVALVGASRRRKPRLTEVSNS